MKEKLISSKAAVWLFLTLLSVYSCNPTSKIISTSSSDSKSQSYPSPQFSNNWTSYPLPNQSSQTERTEPELPAYAPEPLPSKGSISGVLYSFTTQQILTDTLFYLKPIKDEVLPNILVGPQPDRGDIVSRSNEKGQFFLNDIPRGNYIIVVQAYYDWLIALESPDKSSSPLKIVIQEGQKQPLGLVFVGGP